MNILNNRGSAILQVVLAAAVIGGLGLFVMKSGSLQSLLQKQVKVDDYINQTKGEISSLLANSTTCSNSRDGGFSAIGPFAAGYEIDKGPKLRIQRIEPGVRVGREQSIDVFFEYYVAETKSTKTLKKTFPLIYYFSTTDSGDEVESCVSFEAEKLSNGQVENCETSGGIYNSSIGKCEYSSIQETDFTNMLKVTACKVVGGVYTGSFCNGIDISGPITTSHLQNSEISVQGTTRSGLESFSCTGIQVAKGFKEDGTLECTDIVCPKISTSSYIAIDSGGDIKCQCQRDKTLEKPSFACGDQDPQSCVDYEVNDGCGLGNLCTIKRGKFPTCPKVAACDESVTNSCGEVCSVGPPCGISCTDTTWTADESTVCSGEVFTQTSNCGATRTAIGTKDCSSSSSPNLQCPMPKPYCRYQYLDCLCGKWKCTEYKTYEC